MACVWNSKLVLQPDITAAPLVLCHICAWWRRVALESPRLWQRLNLEVNTFRVRLKDVYRKRFIFPFMMGFLDWWWNNAGKRPMTFCIHETVTPESAETAPPRRKLRLAKVKLRDLKTINAVLHSPLVRSARVLHFSNGSYDNLKLICSQTVELPHLESVTLGELTDSWTANSLCEFANAPMLRRMHLTRTGVAFNQPNHQITHLFISYKISFTLLRELLATRCPNLLIGGFELTEGYQSGIPITPSEKKVTVSKLRQLTLSGFPINSECSPLFGLSLPSLSALRISQLETQQDAAVTLENLLAEMPNLSELHLPSSYLYSVGSAQPTLEFDTKRTAIGNSIRQLGTLVLEVSFAVTKERVTAILEILKSQWFQPAPTSRRGHVYVEVLDSSMSALFSPEAERLLFDEVKLLQDSSSFYDISIFRSRRTNWSWRELPEDLTFCEDALGFYDKIV